MKTYPLHDLNNEDFENLTTLICRRILGEATIPFAKGTDGGRDGRFHGKANCFPSESKPWEGKTVIQAKHTNRENTSCSDSDFKTIMKNEVLPAIKRLQEVDKINNYILFTNRKLTGKQDEKIEDLIEGDTGIENIIIGNEKIQQWLKVYPEIVREAKLHDLLRPLQFDERDLKEIIVSLSSSIPTKEKLESSYSEISYLELNKKNTLNELGKEYFEGVMKSHFMYFEFIRTFLSDPINTGIKDLYEDTIDELNAKITLQRNNYSCFESLLDELYNHVITFNEELKGKKRLVRVILHYMYCNCDIGKKDTI